MATLELDSLHIWMAGSDVPFGQPPVLSAADNDAISNTTNWLADSASNLISVRTRPQVYNGTTWDRERAHEEGTVMVSASRTVQTDVNFPNVMGIGLFTFLDITVSPGLGSLKVQYSWRDPVTGKKFVIGTGNVHTAVGSYFAYAGLCGGTAGAPGDLLTLEPLPRSLTLSVIPATADPYTYSLGYCLNRG